MCKGNQRIWECRVFKEKSPTERAKVVAEAKLCFSCLGENHMLSNAQIPGNAGRTDVTAPTIHFSMELREFMHQNPLQPTIVILVVAQIKVNFLVSSSKITTLSSVIKMKGILQVTELRLKSSSGKYSTALVLCDTACSNSWVSYDLSNRLGLQGTALKLTVKGINTEEVLDTELVELIVTPRDNQAFEPLNVSPYVQEDLNVGADVINIKALQETYPHLAVLDAVT